MRNLLPLVVRESQRTRWRMEKREREMNKRSMVVTGIILLITLGCSISGGTDPKHSVQATPDSPPMGGGLEFTWPESIPDDIPVLEGDISMVMEAPGSRIRIFYHNLAKGQLEQYLALLDEEGFELEYLVFTREGYPDKSEERLKRGEYDAVDITKGEYHMRIQYGSDVTTYDIDTTGS
jgi:hypothetical protein